MDGAKSSFDIEKEVWRCWGVGGGGCSGALKNQWGRGEGVNSGYRTKGLITWARLARFAEIPAPWLSATKINFAILWQPSQPGQLGPDYCDAGISGGNFPSNHACRAARRMNQARNRTAGNTLFLRIASPAHVIRPLQWVVLSRSFARKSFGICRFRGSCMRENDSI